MSAGGPAPARVLQLIDGFDGQNFPAFLAAFDPNRFAFHVWVVRGTEPWQRDALETADATIVAARAASRRHYPTVLARLVALIRRARIDLVQAHGFDASVLAVAAARLTRVPVVVTRHHGDMHHIMNRPFHRQVDRATALFATRVIAVSNAVRDVLVRLDHTHRGKVAVVPNGIDLARHQVSPDAARAVREELGLGGRLVVTVPARLHWIKGHRSLLDALRHVIPEVGDDLAVLFAGRGPEQAALERHAANSGVGNVVRFLGWRGDLPAVLTASDAVVVPSRSETFGQVVVEAMACGVPVLATAVGGIPEIIDHDVSGLLVPPDDPDELAHALTRLLTGRQLRSRLAAAGRDRKSVV